MSRWVSLNPLASCSFYTGDQNILQMQVVVQYVVSAPVE